MLFNPLRFLLGMRHSQGKVTAKLPLLKQENSVPNKIAMDTTKKNAEEFVSGAKNPKTPAIDVTASLRTRKL